MRHLSPWSKTIKSVLSMFCLVFIVACGASATPTETPPAATTGAASSGNYWGGGRRGQADDRRYGRDPRCPA